MRLAGIYFIRHHAYKTTTNSNHKHPLAPNLLKQNFSFDKPNQALVGDIIYIPTGKGCLYLAIVKNLCTCKIVGYAFSDHIDTVLTLDVLDMAVRRYHPSSGCIFHSDRGVQYAASTFRDQLHSYVILQNMSCKETPLWQCCYWKFLYLSEMWTQPSQAISFSSCCQNWYFRLYWGFL